MPWSYHIFINKTKGQLVYNEFPMPINEKLTLDNLKTHLGWLDSDLYIIEEETKCGIKINETWYCNEESGNVSRISVIGNKKYNRRYIELEKTLDKNIMIRNIACDWDKINIVYQETSSDSEWTRG